MKAYVFLALALYLAITVAGCSRPAQEQAPAVVPNPDAATSAGTDSTAGTPETPPGADTHAAAFKHAGQMGVTPGSTSGNVQILPVESDYKCNHRDDCTFTKYSNVPRSGDDCQCASPCTPYVVNKAEAGRREAANKSHCTTNDWFGDQCPAPPCSFTEFDYFKCEDGKCVGMALGE